MCVKKKDKKKEAENNSAFASLPAYVRKSLRVSNTS